MQNRIIFLLLAILFGVALYAEEKNWIDNPGFEGSWNSNDVPEWWSASSDPYITTKETSITHGGNYAVKITGKQSLATLNQSTEHISPIQDEIYELSFYYYMVQSQGSDDIRLNCSWNDANLGAYNTDVLTQSFTATQTGQWEIKTIQTAAPKNAYSFYFEAKIPAGASVIFDDFSFKKIENTGPSMDVNPKTLSKVTTTINTPVVLPKITVTTANLTRPVDVWISGTNSAYFTTEVATIPTTQNTTEIITTYLPTVAGNHTAVLNIDPGVAGLFESIPLSGEATNPTLNPKIEVDRASYTFPDVEVGKSDTVAILVHTENLSEWPSARMIDNGEPNGAFLRLDDPVKNGDKSIRVVFRPAAAGTFTKRMEIYCNGVTSAFVDFMGTATGSISELEKQGDSYPLDPSNPLSLMTETFDPVIKNQPVSLPQWKNIAEKNYRAWWGFDFADEEGINYVAKATAYNSINQEAVPYEMWLITPPLDYVNAASKLFTFRAMGDFMNNEDGTDDARLEVYYIFLQNDGTPYTSKINGLNIQVGADFNGQWQDSYLELSNLNNNVFFIGFKFSATGGNASTIQYYIDDVTWGRTDITIPDALPNILPESETVAVFDIMGRKVDKNHLKNGLYIIQTQENRVISRRKIMIK